MQFHPPVKTSCPSAEKVHETPTSAECTSPLENLHCTSSGLSDRTFLAHQKGLLLLPRNKSNIDFFKGKLNADHFLTLKSSQNILTDWEIVTTESIKMRTLKLVIPYSWERCSQQIQYLIYNLR